MKQSSLLGIGREQQLEDIDHSMCSEHFEQIAMRTEGWNCSEIAALCRYAAMVPVHELGQRNYAMQTRAAADGESPPTYESQSQHCREVLLDDFEEAFKAVLGSQRCNDSRPALMTSASLDCIPLSSAVHKSLG